MVSKSSTVGPDFHLVGLNIDLWLQNSKFETEKNKTIDQKHAILIFIIQHKSTLKTNALFLNPEIAILKIL